MKMIIAILLETKGFFSPGRLLSADIKECDIFPNQKDLIKLQIDIKLPNFNYIVNTAFALY
jgi:hypothetical protein